MLHSIHNPLSLLAFIAAVDINVEAEQKQSGKTTPNNTRNQT
jgi:hypothetical protein